MCFPCRFLRMHRGLLLRKPALSFSSSFLSPFRSTGRANTPSFTSLVAPSHFASSLPRYNLATQASPAANALRRHYREVKCIPPLFLQINFRSNYYCISLQFIPVLFHLSIGGSQRHCLFADLRLAFETSCLN